MVTSLGRANDVTNLPIVGDFVTMITWGQDSREGLKAGLISFQDEAEKQPNGMAHRRVLVYLGTSGTNSIYGIFLPKDDLIYYKLTLKTKDGQSVKQTDIGKHVGKLLPYEIPLEEAGESGVGFSLRPPSVRQVGVLDLETYFVLNDHEEYTVTVVVQVYLRIDGSKARSLNLPPVSVSIPVGKQ
jgi:hypothetical protein